MVKLLLYAFRLMRQCSEAQQENDGRVPAALVHLLHSVMAKISVLQSILGDEAGSEEDEEGGEAFEEACDNEMADEEGDEDNGRGW